MPEDALERVLRLVAEGRLSAEDAGPLLDALEVRERLTTKDDPTPTAASATTPSGGPGRALRIEVVENGRKVVNLRVPLALGRAALSRIPGLSETTSDRVREAIESGLTGPILTVDEGAGDGVRILVE